MPQKLGLNIAYLFGVKNTAKIANETIYYFKQGEDMSGAAVLFFIFALGIALLLISLISLIPCAKCVHLYEIGRGKIKCIKCGFEEWR